MMFHDIQSCVPRARLLPNGILQDLIVRPNNDGFEIVAGRRRFYSAKVIEAERGELTRLTAFIMAETLASGSDAVAIIGAEQKIDVRTNWTPDQTFFDLVRDRASLNAMLADAAGKKEANKLVSAKAKDQRAALAQCVRRFPPA